MVDSRQTVPRSVDWSQKSRYLPNIIKWIECPNNTPIQSYTTNDMYHELGMKHELLTNRW